MFHRALGVLVSSLEAVEDMGVTRKSLLIKTVLNQSNDVANTLKKVGENYIAVWTMLNGMNDEWSGIIILC